MLISTIAHPISLRDDRTRWLPFAEVHYDFKKPNGWATIVIRKYGRIYAGTFVGKFLDSKEESDKSELQAPRIEGGIMTCTKDRGEPTRIGRIYTNMDEFGNFKDYRGMFDNCTPVGLDVSANGNIVLPIFLD